MRWEFSLCRVYVISGSFRAFDRRPLEKDGSESRAKVDGLCSSEISHFEGLHGSHSQMLEVRESSSTNWDVNNNNNDKSNNEVQLQEPLWELEWEQFNWL